MSPYFGANAQSDGSTLFRLWAPTAGAGLRLEIVGRTPIDLRPDPDGLVEQRVPDCPPGTRYYYRLPDGRRVPDPASRLQDGDVHDRSIVIAPGDYSWVHPHWQPPPWECAVIYEVHVGLAGGYQGLCERLPDLAALGVTVIELMPIADFPGPRNWGYDGVLPYAPDTAYGTPTQLKRLIDCAHGLGLAVMLDVVYNHFGPEGNYLPVLAEPFFRDNAVTPWGTAIDFGRAEVVRFIEDSACHWLQEYRFDGLRLDAVHAIDDEDWLRDFPRRLRARLAPRRIYLAIEDDHNRAGLLRSGFDAQWNDDGHHVLHHLLTGETTRYYHDYCVNPANILSRCLAQGWHYQGQTSQFRHGKNRGEPSHDLPPSSFIWFLQNHDQIGNRPEGERLRELCDEQSLCAAIALQLLSPGVPMLFMGEEIGSCSPFLYFTSYADAALAEAVRLGRQRECAAPDTIGELPEPNSIEAFERSHPWRDNGDGRVWMDGYTHLLDVRRRYLTSRLTGARSESTQTLGPAAVQARWRLSDGASLTLLTNLGHASCPLPDGLTVTARHSLRYESVDGGLAHAAAGELAARCTLCLVEEPQ